VDLADSAVQLAAAGPSTSAPEPVRRRALRTRPRRLGLVAQTDRLAATSDHDIEELGAQRLDRGRDQLRRRSPREVERSFLDAGQVDQPIDLDIDAVTTFHDRHGAPSALSQDGWSLVPIKPEQHQCLYCASLPIFPPRSTDDGWAHAIVLLCRRLNPARRSNPRLVKRKYVKWHVKRACHRAWPQPAGRPVATIIRV